MPNRRIVQLTDTMSTKDRVIICASEAGGTAILVFLGCMGCVAPMAGGFIPHQQISFTFGLAVMAAVQIFGHISGSHINPVVTVCAATLGNISLIQVPVYFVGQMLGALLGFGFLLTVTPEDKIGNIVSNITGLKQPGICSPGFSPYIGPAQACFVEFLLCLILALFCCGVWDARNNDKHDSVPLRFGLCITVLALAGGPYSGANMNPARSFAPALFNGDWQHHWVYWLGPLPAGFVGAILYRLVFKKKETASTDTVPEAVALSQKP